MPWDNFLLDTTFKNRINTLGQKPAAYSTPVVLASDQPAIPVSIEGGNINLNIGTVNQGNPGALPWPVSIASLPAGLATEPTLAGVASSVSRIPPLGQALEAASVPVVLTALQIAALTPPAAITGFATEATLASIKNTDGIKKITDPVETTPGDGWAEGKTVGQSLTGATGLPVQVADGSTNAAWLMQPLTQTQLTAASLATEAKQLPNNHQVSVSNFPTEQGTHDAGIYNQILRLLEQVSVPMWYDYATNSLKAVVSGAVTATVSSTSVSNLSSIGGYGADPCVASDLNTVWATAVRSLLI